MEVLPWSSGSQVRATTFSGEGGDGRRSINLRNLGNASTLSLVNGRRQVASWFDEQANATVNVNALVPNIAIERIEIVKDGASALYGSDAVAGVVNFITKRDFEGFDLNYQYTVDDPTGEGVAHTLEVIFGVQGADGGMVAAASVLNRDPITIGDRYERFGGSSVSGTGQPGRFTPVLDESEMITWAAHGMVPGQPVADGRYPRDEEGKSFGQADVDCETAAAFDGEGGTLGTVFGNLICAYDFGSFFSMQAEESLRKFNVAGHYNLTDSVEVYFEFAANDTEFDRFNSLNPNSPALRIEKNHPGAVEDAYRRGIEPIAVLNITRMLGGTVDLIGSQYRPIETYTNISRSNQRLVIGEVWDFGDSWSMDLSFTASENDAATTQVQDTLSSHMKLAIDGLGGPECDHGNGTPGEGNIAYAENNGDFGAGKCYYFNPFGNSQFARDGSVQTDLKLRNPPELYEWLLGRITNDAEHRQRVIDLVLTGDLWDTNAGPVGLAVGFQRRRTKSTVDYDAAGNTNNLDFVYGAADWSGALTTTAYFVELGLPLGSRIDLNLALRAEDFDELGEDTTDPKVSVIYRMTDDVTLRTSISSAFRVPSLQQLFGTLTTVHNLSDFNRDAAFRAAISPGNPNLLPEEADTFNFGLSWVPSGGALEGLEFHLDYYSYDYTNIITRESHNTVLAEDNAMLAAHIFPMGLPDDVPHPDSEQHAKNVAAATAMLQGAVADGRLERAVAADIGNREQVIRSPVGGSLLRVLPGFRNANSAEVTGFDITASYTWPVGSGDMKVGLLMAWVDEYTVEVPSRTPGGAPTVFDAVGEYNNRNPVARPLPQLKMNATWAWTFNRHRVHALLRRVDEVNFNLAGDAAAGFWRETIALAHGPEVSNDYYTDTVEAFTTLDLKYTYNMGEMMGFIADSSFTVGAHNILDEEPPWVPVNTGFDATLHDPRGRIWYLRLATSL